MQVLVTCSFCFSLIPSLYYSYHSLHDFVSLPATDQEDDFVEPDLSKYASIDMSTLRDVSKIGMDYVLSMEALLHMTPDWNQDIYPRRMPFTC